ncbi:hypothetical protein WCD74_11605 [Actinomycetospora sp. OC33-EN08]|uniref:Uncharacterized protein n=1 Tax=Actinomycetospora aurantiaca TaxID=3129233 RepID=A0ABU8MM96_9PSEU
MKQACGRCGKWFVMEHDGEGDGAPDDIASPWVFPAHQSRGTVRAIGQDVTTSSECGGSGRNEWETHNAV